MPIRPEMRDRYPAYWPEISHRIRFERAGGRCECDGRCGLDHGGDRCPELDGEPHSVTGSIVVLTVAHLNHAPEESADDNLMALCQRCHLAHDRPEHQRIARLRRSRERRRRATGSCSACSSPRRHARRWRITGGFASGCRNG